MRRLVVAVNTITASALTLACTDVGLYQRRQEAFVANKLTVRGRVCTDDPRQRNFPIKVLFVVDTSLSVQAPENDATGERGRAVDQMVSTLGKDPNFHFGVISFAGRARNLIDEGFTQDSAKLSAAANALSSGGGIGGVGGCISGRCRDLRAAMSLASSVITGDILASEPGQISRTSYVVVLFSGGPPVPAIGRCACRDRQTETIAENWANCPWAECDGCRVSCPPNTACDDTVCRPVCRPGCDNDEYCDVDFTCKDGTARPTVAPLSNSPPSRPDTFNYWVLPAQHGLDLSQTKAANGGQQPGACVATCVYYANGGGHTDSCEERVLVGAVRELKAFVRTNGAAQFQFHSTYLPDGIDYALNPSPMAPLCDDPASDRARAVRLLSEMAFAGNGGFTEFAQTQPPATANIYFDSIDLDTSTQALVVKELVVTNASVLAAAAGDQLDSDEDGLADATEATLNTCPSDADSDGDGIGDAVEVQLALSPTETNEPIECRTLETSEVAQANVCTTTPPACNASTPGCGPGEYNCPDCGGVRATCLNGTCAASQLLFGDQDRDGLNTCEERLLGTVDTLFDTDADGIPDKVEFVAGTNYLAGDQLQDIDFDGIVNREEVRGHTDARANDAQEQLDLAYRYQETDEGIQTILSFSQPRTVSGVTIKSTSEETNPGVGFLEFNPGPPPTLRWRDPAHAGVSGDFGPPVDISQPSPPEGYQLSSTCLGSECDAAEDKNFITVAVVGSGYPPLATTDRILVSSARRNCLTFRVRNITLMETAPDPILQQPGNNSIYIYFSQAPLDAKDSFGIFRVATLRVNYRQGPPEQRTPPTAEVVFRDEDFVLIE